MRPRRASVRTLVLSAALFGLALPAAPATGAPATATPVPPPAAAEPRASDRYVFTALTNGSESNMSVYTSSDALNFTLLKADAYTPPSGQVRDPSVLRAPDGSYRIVYATGRTGQTIGIAGSTDLKDWTFLATVDVGVPGMLEARAPEWFVDPSGSTHIVVSLSADPADPAGLRTGFRPYVLTAQDTSLVSFTGAAPLNGYFAGRNYLGTFVVVQNGIYHAFAGNGSTGYIEHLRSISLSGPWSLVGNGNWSGWGGMLEAPALVQLHNGSWRIYLHGYGSPESYVTATSPNLDAWSATAELPGGLSGVVRHGTVLHETATAPHGTAPHGTAPRGTAPS